MTEICVDFDDDLMLEKFQIHNHQRETEVVKLVDLSRRSMISLSKFHVEEPKNTKM